MAQPKKTQRRRCGNCQTVGHNKATCPRRIEQNPTSAPAGLHFFVHHVADTPRLSAHRLDLKNEPHSLWDDVTPSAGNSDGNSLYHSYHTARVADIPAVREPIALPSPAPIADRPLMVAKPAKRSPIASARPRLQDAAKKDWIALRQKITTNINSVKVWFQRLVSLPRFAAVAGLAAGSLLLPYVADAYFQNLSTTKTVLTEAGTTGFISLLDSTNALKQGNFATASAATGRALDQFNAALNTLDSQHKVLQTIVSAIPVVNNQLAERENLLLSGQEIAVGNSYLLNAITSGSSAADNRGTASSTFTDRLRSVADGLHAALPDYDNALANFSAVDPDIIPAEHRRQFSDLQQLLPPVVHDLHKLSDLSDTLLQIVGGNGFKRYLIVFQNPHELRPTGGFIGSLAVMTIDQGEITSLEIPPGGSYDFQGQLDQYLEPPAPLTLLDKRWEFQDANWFPDFPTSAEKILWFYRHSRGVSADGVIAINATVLERLLAVFGPLVDPSRQLVLTADNALPTIQDAVENGPDKTKNQPKKILADLAPQLFSLIKNNAGRELVPALTNLSDALKQKEIQAYFTDQPTEQALQTFGWSGAIAATPATADYLSVINTNIGGEKSDARINQTITHQAAINRDGVITDTVTITRQHTGAADEKLYGAVNVDYLRVYVPAGSKLISASGFSWPDDKNFRAPEPWYKRDGFLASVETETGIDPLSGTRVTNEFGKTAFGNWMITKPGSVTTAQFVYQLPFAAATTDVAHYQLLVQRQSGSVASFASQIVFPAGWHGVWNEGDGSILAPNGLNITAAPLTHDQIWSLIMSKR